MFSGITGDTLVTCWLCDKPMPSDFSGDIPVMVDGVEKYVCSNRCVINVSILSIVEKVK